MVERSARRFAKRDAFASGKRNNDAGGHRYAPFGRAVSGRAVVEPLARSKGYAPRGSPNHGLKRPRQNASIWSESALDSEWPAVPFAYPHRRDKILLVMCPEPKVLPKNLCRGRCQSSPSSGALCWRWGWAGKVPRIFTSWVKNSNSSSARRTPRSSG